MSEEHIEEITLYNPGALPGIPGEHAAGILTVDWQQRTVLVIRPFGPPAAMASDSEIAPVVPSVARSAG